jgi:hypothetical protein
MLSDVVTRGADLSMRGIKAPRGTAYCRSLDDRSSDHLGYIVLLLALSFVCMVAIEAWVWM